MEYILLQNKRCGKYFTLKHLLVFGKCCDLKPTTSKFEWDKATLALANANNKAINAIFCGVSTDEFHRLSHVGIAKEAWTILETTYESAKKVKNT